MIGEKTHTLARLIPSEGVPSEGRFDIEIHQGVDRQALAQAKSGSVRNSRLACPHCGESSAMGAIRGDRRGDSGAENCLRLWDNADLVPRPDDTFLERLYCVRWRLPQLDALLWTEQQERADRPHDRPIPDWVPLDRAITGLAEFLDASDRLDLDELRARDWLAEDTELESSEAALVTGLEAKAPKARLDAHRKQLRMLRANQAQRTADLKALTERLPGVLYRAAEAADLEREARVLTLLRERFNDWQTQGYIPSRQIVPGDLVPKGLDAPLWRRLTPEEKLYLKCLEVESHGDYRSGVFQEFARGLGVREYRFMLESGKANQPRQKTATEFKRRDWGTEGFGSSLLRHCLFAVYQAVDQAVDQDSTKIGLTYLKTEIRDYWTHRETLTGLLDFLGRIGIPHWAEDAEAARLLAGRVANDHI